MSEQVYKTGKIKLVEKDGEELWQQCKRILEEEYGRKYTESLYSPEDYISDFMEEIYYDYVLLDDRIYEVVEINDLEDCNIYELHDNKDGTMNFVLSYYNGGESFDEAIEEAYERMKNDD